MQFLTPSEIKIWYECSLKYSGYKKLNPWCFEIWKLIVEQGFNSIPPGFVAKVLERLTHKKAGESNINQKDNDEIALINIISSSYAFIQLEGEFLLTSKIVDDEKYIVILKRIIEKLGNFYDSRIVFLAKEINFEQEEESDNEKEEYIFSNILLKLYINATSYAVQYSSALDEDDVFEIFHPKLFSSPTARSLFRKMVNRQRNIRDNVAGEINLIKETEEMAAVFGESQSLPIGGYDSITNKGEMASLVTSELSYIEDGDEIDYFDYKYVQNELMYFKREEGIIFRIRRRIHINISLAYEMEHQRNLADVFALCLVLCEKIFSLFIKDVITIKIYFSDYLPSEITSAITFFEYYLKEGNYHNDVSLHINEVVALEEEVKRYQNWYIGSENLIEMDKHITFKFPTLNNFLPKDRDFFLADVIDDLIEKMALISHF